ncbi:hypothetical protein HS041_30265 [Planomonospora sp. ID67723]|uniref:hypothetical protein n=1 Tax=Planomonospora sp. ID67723 TaxID=2738134 RepID=UPI0018C36700|nr:hypothetical protein [Planomonospora sp. ID67723]MBG0831993.1 hypothetical protein [Planomonospora sp. ID67723]
MTVKVAVIYYSATGTVHAPAQASLEDLAWADAFAFGTPTRWRLAQVAIRLLGGGRVADAAAGDGNARATTAGTTSRTA